VIDPDEIEAAVPVRKDKDGKPMGTLFADIGTWIEQEQNKRTTMYVFDSQIIDRSWRELSPEVLKSELQNLADTGVKTARTPYADLHINAYNQYLGAGGNIAIEKCTNKLLQKLLDVGPVLAIISYNYMYDYPRLAYDFAKKDYVPDPVNGKVLEHAVLLTGYERNSYYYNDPEYEFGGEHKVDSDVLIGAICSAQINSDNYLLAIN